jgi:hypothetical protein
MSEEYNYIFKVAIDGMDVPSVLSILQIHSDKDYWCVIGFDFFVKFLYLFDPRKNENVIVKVQVWVIAIMTIKYAPIDNV